MARTVRDANLESRAARSRLTARHKPYWRKIDQGHHVGYYKGKRAGTWVARYFVGNGKYAETKLGNADDIRDGDDVGVLSFAQAQAKAREWFTEQTRRAAGLGPDRAYTVAAAMSDYLTWYKAHRKALGATEQAVKAHILPALGEVELAKLTTVAIRRWHEGLAASPARLRSGLGKPQNYRPAPTNTDGRRRRQATANRVLTILKAGLNHAWQSGHATNDESWRRVKPFRDADAPRVRYLNIDECTRLANASAPDFRDLIKAALLTGCRYGELTAMRCHDFNPDTGTVSVHTTKGGKPRHIPLNDEGVAFFKRVVVGRLGEETMLLRADGAAWRRSHQGRRLKDAAKAAKVHNVSFHILRHTYGSALAMNGVPMGVIAAALGHADTRMTERHYAALAPSYIADTIRANLPKLGLVEPDKIVGLPRRPKRTQQKSV